MFKILQHLVGMIFYLQSLNTIYSSQIIILSIETTMFR